MQLAGATAPTATGLELMREAFLENQGRLWKTLEEQFPPSSWNSLKEPFTVPTSDLACHNKGTLMKNKVFLTYTHTKKPNKKPQPEQRDAEGWLMRCTETFLATGNEYIYIIVSGNFSQTQLKMSDEENRWRAEWQAPGWESDCRGEWVQKE